MNKAIQKRNISVQFSTLSERLCKSSLIVLAGVLVACAGNVDTQQAGEQNSEQKIAHSDYKKNESETSKMPVGIVSSNDQSIQEQSNTVQSNVQSHSEQVVVTASRLSHGYHHSDADAYLPNNTEKYAQVDESSIKQVSESPVSTFSIDVDTGSYTNVRRMLNQGYLPPAEAVRVEEFINYFDYNYAIPKRSSEPFRVNTELSQTPWNPVSKLLKVGLRAYDVDYKKRPSANLVFLMDVSGSMNSADKLPLLKKSFRMLSKNLTSNDSVSIVVYAGASGVVLEPTSGDNKRQILSALSRLRAGGSTNGAAGIELAYQMAEEAYIEDGINRIILATDGDFNVGTSNVAALKRLVENKRKSGISLTTLGFGSGNYNDHLMEQIADIGNGNNAYIDSVKEAEKVLVTEMSSTLLTVAKDVKIQVEFNPMNVAEYRLIGYENRALQREDFNNDKVDAGEIGAGHTVTALYEIFPVNSNSAKVDSLRYSNERVSSIKKNNEIAFVKLRFKYPDAEKSHLLNYVVKTRDERKFSRTSSDFKFATAVSAFGQKLKRSEYIGDYSFDEIYSLAEENIKRDKYGYRSELVELVAIASELTGDDPEHYISQQ
jgi:Ca-activated chloride channel family protein